MLHTAFNRGKKQIRKEEFQFRDLSWTKENQFQQLCHAEKMKFLSQKYIKEKRRPQEASAAFQEACRVPQLRICCSLTAFPAYYYRFQSAEGK